MATKLDEGKQCIPISELKPLQTEWLIKVLVLWRGPKRDYKTSNGEGVIRSVIFVDEEGTKIQGTLFNEQIETWEDDFKPLQAYYIKDGKIFTPKANYLSVNTDVEISFRQYTKITECDTDFNTQNFAAGFIPFVEAARMPLGTLFDVASILLDVKVLIGEGRKTRREAVITDDRYDRKTVTLWGDLAEIEGALMASSKHDNPVVAFCNIKGSIYQGEFGLSTTPVSCVLIELHFETVDHLHKWHTAMKACSVDIRFMPSRLMQETTKVALTDIVKPASSSFKAQYYRFVAKLINIINLDDLWYAACKKCFKKVIVKKSTASCEYCRKKDTVYENRSAQTKLNPEQEHAYKTILERVTSATPGLFFVDGPGGTGKTFLYRALLANVRSNGMIALATATSGVAASILPGGRTAHSRFDIPLQTDETTITNMSKQGGAAKLIRKARLVIWDEAPMAKRQTIETVDRSFRDIMESDAPFGGKVMVFGGDFRQVLPVVPKATRAQTVNACLVKSYLWPLMKKLQFKTNMRAISDPTFSDFLLRVGNGDESTIGDNLIRLPDEVAVKYDNEETATDSLIEQIFPALHENAGSAQYVIERAILASRNEHSDYLNEMLVEKFPGESKAYVSFDSAEDDTNNYYQEEYLRTLTPNGLPPHRLVLKKNAPIMLLRNLDASNGLCNCTRLICRGFDKNVIHAEIMLGNCAGKNAFLPRIQLSPRDNEGYPFKFVRKQFPVRLCFAMTINKAQGQTISNCGLYLPQHVFSYGQLYVALSRGTSMSTTRVLVMTEQPIRRIGTYTKNVVYKEVLGE